MIQPADTPNNLPIEETGENLPLDDIPVPTNSLESTEPPVQDFQPKDPDQTSPEVRVESNTDLVDRVMQLESELAVATRQLQLYQEHCQAQDAKLSGQSEELSSLKEQHSQLRLEKEACQQTSQRQQILIETLTEQLETNKEQVAQLERDSALTQQRYDSQTTKLSQAEATCRDLRSRLYRQQRYTLQFKNALEKCLEMTGDRDGIPASSTDADSVSIAKIQGVVPKSPAIKPWSATWSFVEPPGDRDLELDSELPIVAMSSPDDWQKTADSSTVNDADQTVQLDQFGETQVPSDPGPPWEPEDREWQESDPWADETVAQIHESVPPAATEGPESEEIGNVVSIEAQPESQVRASTALAQPESQVRASTASENSSQKAERFSLLSQTNSPSPLVYPLRPHKKIKSLAAIDLPTFPR